MTMFCWLRELERKLKFKFFDTNIFSDFMSEKIMEIVIAIFLSAIFMTLIFPTLSEISGQSFRLLQLALVFLIIAAILKFIR